MVYGRKSCDPWDVSRRPPMQASRKSTPDPHTQRTRRYSHTASRILATSDVVDAPPRTPVPPRLSITSHPTISAVVSPPDQDIRTDTVKHPVCPVVVEHYDVIHSRQGREYGSTVSRGSNWAIDAGNHPPSIPRLIR